MAADVKNAAADRTAIASTDATFNPWWGCTRLSPACAHCYADTLARRYGHQLWGDGSPRQLFGEQHWAQPGRWNRQAERAGQRLKVFCASMADVFEEHPELDPRQHERTRADFIPLLTGS